MSNALAGRNQEESWRQDLWRRIRALWLVKMLVTTSAMVVFMLVYFWVLRHPFFPITIMPLTALDRAIGFQPWAMPFYASLWAYVALVPALLRDGREFALYCAATFAMSVIGLGIFMLWPTAVPAFHVDWTLYPSVRFLKRVDLAGNACPSFHVAYSVFTAIWLHRMLRQMRVGWMPCLVNAVWCAGIVFSTMAMLQHVALDVLGGVLLGAMAAVGATWRFRRVVPGTAKLRVARTRA